VSKNVTSDPTTWLKQNLCFFCKAKIVFRPYVGQVGLLRRSASGDDNDNDGGRSVGW